MGNLNLKIIYRFLGLTAVLNGVFMFIALPFSMFHQETAQMGILNAGIVTIFMGLILYFFNKPTTLIFKKKKGISLLLLVGLHYPLQVCCLTCLLEPFPL